MNRLIILGVVAAVAAVPLVSHMGGTDRGHPMNTAVAQEQAQLPGAEQGGALDQELMQAQIRFQALEQELLAIQDRVLSENEEFQARAEELDERLFDRMEATGYDSLRGDIGQLEEILDRAEAGEISEQEAEAQMQQHTEIHLRLQQAHEEAMQDEAFAESFAQAQQTLSDDLIATMKETDPRTEGIIEEMKTIESELMQALIERGQGQAPPAEGGLQQ